MKYLNLLIKYMKSFKPLVYIIGQIVIFIMCTLLPVPQKMAIFISLGILVGGIFCSLFVYFILNILKKDKNDCNLEENEYCKSELLSSCPFSMAIKRYNLQIPIDSKYTNKYRLFEKEEIYKKELMKDWKNIWIFSGKIENEIDENRDMEDIVKTNISHCDTKYTIFYIDTDINRNNNEKLIEEFRKKMPSEKKDLLEFKPICVNNELSEKKEHLGNRTVPLFCGGILFSSKFDKDNMPLFTEGYLSISNDNDDDPIYYNMPLCMLSGYSKYFKDIYFANKN